MQGEDYLSELSDDISLEVAGQRGLRGRSWPIRYQRSRTDPQVKPPPIASSMTRSPGLMRPSAMPTERASGIEAAEVLPCRSTVRTTFSGASPSFLAVS